MSIPYPRGGGVCSLDKFGISIDADQGQGPLMQPLVKYKFRVLLFNFGGMGETAEPITLNTNTVSLPSLSHQSQEIHSYNSVSYYAGKHTWGTSSLIVRDTVDGTVSKAVGSQLQRQLDHYNQTSFRSAADYKFKMVVQALDGGHDSALMNYHICGCFLESADWGDLDYSSSEARTINLTVRPDNVIIEGANAGGMNTIFTNPGSDPLSGLIAR